MDGLQLAVLALIDGLTERLPISSSVQALGGALPVLGLA